MDGESFEALAYSSGELKRIADALESIATHLERQAQGEDDLLRNEYAALKEQARDANHRFSSADANLLRRNEAWLDSRGSKPDPSYANQLEQECITIHEELAAFERKYPHLLKED